MSKTLTAFAAHGLDPKKEFGTNNTKVIGKRVRLWLIDYTTTGPIVKMVIQGPSAIAMVRKIVGSTMPQDAEVGTIRGDFSVDSGALANLEKRVVANLVHSSENKEEAEHEIAFWFGADFLKKRG